MRARAVPQKFEQKLRAEAKLSLRSPRPSLESTKLALTEVKIVSQKSEQKLRAEARLSFRSPRLSLESLSENKALPRKSEQKQDCPSEVRVEPRLSLGSPSGCILLLRQLMELSLGGPSRNKAVPRKSEWMRTSTSAANGSKVYPSGVRVRVHSTLKRKILEARIDEIKGCSSDPHQ